MRESVQIRIQGSSPVHIAKMLDTVGWGLFFIWVGVSLLAKVGWGVGILGLGVITVGAQLGRKYFGLPIELFWLVIGIVWCTWGLVIELGGLAIPGGPVPIVFIVVGVIFVVSAFWRKR